MWSVDLLRHKKAIAIATMLKLLEQYTIFVR